MKIKIADVLLLLGVLFCGHSNAQNLVPNPSFENHNLCPPNTDGIRPSIEGNLYCDDWISFVGALVFDSCADPMNPQSMNVPNNCFGYRYPRTGNRYAGVMVLADIEPSHVSQCSETWTTDYIQVRLKDSLEAGAWYCVSFYVAPAYFGNRINLNHATMYIRSSAIDQMGAFFSKAMPGDELSPAVVSAPNGYLDLEPQVESRKGWMLDDTSTNWTPITGIFQAEGGERWLSIGTFRSEPELKRRVIYNPFNCNPADTITGNPFYYIDDVNVNKISGTENAGYNTKYQDTIICNADTILQLYAPPGADSYLWNTGATAQVITSEAGVHTYWYKASYIGCGVVTDTIKVVYRQVPLYLGSDTSLCEGTLFSLTPQNGGSYDAYEWNTGATTPEINVTTNGTYLLSTTDACGSQLDSIMVFFKPKPDALPGLDTTICQFSNLDSFRIAGMDLKWYNESNDIKSTPYPLISTENVGRFSYYISQVLGGCESDKTKVLFNIIASPVLELGPDTVFCPGVAPLIGVAGNDSLLMYLWNTGEQTPFVMPPSSGVYILSEGNKCGTASDSIHVLFDECLDCGWLPNSFTPNNDGNNDGFGVEIRCPLRHYQLFIYNRWGQRIFQSYDPKNRWKGEKEDVGTYFYRVQYENSNNHKMIYKKGDVTLIR